ncbi:unnamed protein product [Ilex paraguariensis]|uniref:LRAT domain-containing protein n=1 Tax=Ilex paraguariensis TaxID=185542 RepID=A0ABC8TGT5_9AQUA
MGLLSNRVDRDSLKPGDHIYSWRSVYIYAHHGIYVGDNKVIHFTRRGQELRIGTVLDVLLVSSRSSRTHVPCSTCNPQDEDHGVVSSCLNCFLDGGILYRFEYAVNPTLFLAKARGGTCTLAISDPDDVVVHRANYLYTNGFGCYNVFNNNCEDFAIYCKTGLLVLDQRTMGQSGQAVSIIGGPLAAVLSTPLRLVTNNVYGMAVTAVGVYCASRVAADIGMRSDVLKVSVEDLTRRLATCTLQVVEPSLPAVAPPGIFSGVTDSNDLAILNQFRDGLENPELLNWTTSDDPCGPPSWPHIVCSGNKVSQIQVQILNLKGTLPKNLNQLPMLSNLGLQKNQFSGMLPSFSGLSELRYAYLGHNNFDTIPSDFFNGLVKLEVLALDYNPLNATTGWLLPSELQNSIQLTNLTLMSCNLVGPLPKFLGNMSSLSSGDGMTGPIDAVSTLGSLNSKIPENIGNLTLLKDLNLNDNDLVGLIPDSLASMDLFSLDLNNNQFMGPIPKFKAANVTYESNPFCQSIPGVPCAPEVMALLKFLDAINYPSKFASAWSGNNPCDGPWLALTCDVNRKVSTVTLPESNLTGTLSPSIANLDSLTQIYFDLTS